MTLSAAKSKNARAGKSYSLVIASEAVRTETGEQVTNTDRLGQCRYGGIGQYLQMKFVPVAVRKRESQF